MLTHFLFPLKWMDQTCVTLLIESDISLSFCRACWRDTVTLFCAGQSFLWESRCGTGADVEGFGVCRPLLWWKLLFCCWFAPLGICLFKIPLENMEGQDIIMENYRWKIMICNSFILQFLKSLFYFFVISGAKEYLLLLFLRPWSLCHLRLAIWNVRDPEMKVNC